MHSMGYVYLAGYILLLGVGTFLQKFTLKQINPYQLEFLIALGMVTITIPALFISQKSLSVPVKEIPIGGFIGLLFASGSLLFTLSLSKLPVGLASGISTSYILIVVALSVIFLNESFNLVKGVGMSLTLIGVILLYFQK